VVKKAIEKKTKKAFAIKIIEKQLCATKLDMIETELSILSKVDHPYVVSMTSFFDCEKLLYLVLHLVTGGELFDRIANEVGVCLCPHKKCLVLFLGCI